MTNRNDVTKPSDSINKQSSKKENRDSFSKSNENLKKDPQEPTRPVDANNPSLNRIGKDPTEQY